MNYSEKIIEHKATKGTPKFNEVVATIEVKRAWEVEPLNYR